VESLVKKKKKTALANERLTRKVEIEASGDALAMSRLVNLRVSVKSQKPNDCKERQNFHRSLKLQLEQTESAHEYTERSILAGRCLFDNELYLHIRAQQKRKIFYEFKHKGKRVSGFGLRCTKAKIDN
jgi:hypothetical protein